MPTGSDNGAPVLGTYAVTARAFGRPLQMTLTADALAVDDGQRTRHIALSEFEILRLSFRPTNTLGRSYLARLSWRGGPPLTFGSRHAAGVARFEDRGPAYGAFLARLAPAIAAANPAARFIAGRSPAVFALLALVSAAWTIAFLVLLAQAWGRTHLLTLLVIAAGGASLIWVMLDMVWRNRPRAFAPDRLPPDLVG